MSRSVLRFVYKRIPIGICARIIVALLCLVVLHALNKYWADLRRRYQQPVTFTFRLPLPGPIMVKYGLRSRPEVRRVYIAGRFSDWKPDHPDFAMEQVNTNTWRIRLSLNPGRNPYKFVIHLAYPGRHDLPPFARNGVIWVEDRTARHFEADGFGGRNSVYVVQKTDTLRALANYSLIALAVGLLAYTLLELAIRLLMRVRLSLRSKLIIVFLVLLVGSNFVTILTVRKQWIAAIARHMSDKLNLIHAQLLSHGVDFSNLSQEAVRSRLQQALDAVFRHTQLRQDYNLFSNTRQPIGYLYVTDTRGELLAYGLESSKRLLLKSLHKDSNAAWASSRRHVRRLFRYYRSRGSGGNSLTLFFGSAITHDEADQKGYEDYCRKCRGFRVDAFVYPIKAGLRPRGYYIGRFHPESYGLFYGKLLRLNLGLLAVMIICCLALVYRVGGAILEPLQRLLKGLTRVRQGELDFSLAIRTGDEFEQLGQVYNYMRTGLKEMELTRGELLANVSHELMTPVTTIRGTVELLLEGEIGNPQEQHQVYHTMFEDVLNLQKLMRNFVLASTLPGENVLRETISLLSVYRKLVENVLPLEWAALIAENQVSVTMPAWEKLQDRDIQVVSNQEYLLHVLKEIGHNAIIFNNPKGSVCFDLERHEEGTVLSVTDSGIGLKPEEKEHMFQLFYRADRSPTYRYRGVGLGLGVARMICNALDHRLEAESEAGQYTRISILIKTENTSVA